MEPHALQEGPHGRHLAQHRVDPPQPRAQFHIGPLEVEHHRRQLRRRHLALSAAQMGAHEEHLLVRRDGLALQVGTEMLGVLLREHEVRLLDPVLDPIRRLPHMLDYFSLSFQLSPRAAEGRAAART